MSLRSAGSLKKKKILLKCPVSQGKEIFSYDFWKTELN